MFLLVLHTAFRSRRGWFFPFSFCNIVVLFTFDSNEQIWIWWFPSSFRRHSEQHIETTCSELLRPGLEIADGAVLVSWPSSPAIFYRYSKALACDVYSCCPDEITTASDAQVIVWWFIHTLLCFASQDSTDKSCLPGCRQLLKYKANVVLRNIWINGCLWINGSVGWFQISSINSEIVVCATPEELIYM